MVIALLPMFAVETEAASYTAAPSISQSQVEEKINSLVKLLDGKYFTTTQKTCGNNKCDKCYNVNVFASSWFKNMFGSVSASQIPGHAYPNGNSNDYFYDYLGTVDKILYS